MAHRMSVKSETLTTTRTLSVSESRAYYGWVLDPGGADRTVVLPTETLMSGQLLHVQNSADAAECLLLVASDTTTVVSRLPRGDDAVLLCDGTTWRCRDRRRLCVLTETLANHRVITAAEVVANPIVAFDPGGAARNVDLPVTTALAGVQFTIVNTADDAEPLTVRLTGAGATVATIEQSEHAVFTCYAATAGAWVGAVSKAT